MILREIDFGPIMCASGAQGYFGEKYQHQKLLGPLGPDFNDCTFVAKTTTLNWRAGNMPMKEDGITPVEFIPKCVYVDFLKGIMLNAVGLSGPGAKTLFETGLWQKRTEPFFISFMSVAATVEERTTELKRFIELFAHYLPDFKAKVGLQINYSCPNIGLDIMSLITEAKKGLRRASVLNIPLMPKFNILAPVDAVVEISESPHCDAICTSNTIPFGKIPNRINWKELFGSDVSPLAKLGGGGLSGKPLLPLVAKWIYRARKHGLKKPINAGGGILSADDLGYMYTVEASSVFIGSVATLRPWRVKGIIKMAHRLF